MFSKGKVSSVSYEDLSNISEVEVAAHYFNVSSIPALISSPFRVDKNPSFSLYSPAKNEINYIDFSTGESGKIWTLLKKLWNCSYAEVAKRVKEDLKDNSFNNINVSASNRKQTIRINPLKELLCKTRNWEKHDIEYWESYGISLKWLKYADVYPISHKIIKDEDKTYVYKADKHAYAFAEFKENKLTLKIYQPFNKNGFKWANRHNKSIISLWTKVPKTGQKICICASLKDALCLWANTGIPSIALQGEGYSMSNSAINDLKTRYKEIYICFDNDEAGLKDAEKLSKTTGFVNVVLPKFKEGKDISDYYKYLGNKELFKETLLKLFNYD